VEDFFFKAESAAFQMRHVINCSSDTLLLYTGSPMFVGTDPTRKNDAHPAPVPYCASRLPSPVP
jgi:hypothetical protein